MNVQRFLKKERLFTDVKDAYEHICEQYFLHQDQAVRERIQDVCGKVLFKQEKNLFSSKAPYTGLNHSITADLITGSPSKPVNYSTFKKVMKRKIFPFRFMNLGRATKSELSIRTLFLSILANAFMHGVSLYFKEPLCSMEEPFKTFGLSNDQIVFPDSTWFYSYGIEPQRPSLEKECYLTYFLIKDSKNQDPEKNMRNYIMLYLWNRDTLVVDAFISNFHRFKRKILYPNFLWIILTKDNGMPRSHQSKIIEAIEEELLPSWSYSIYRDIFIYNKENANYIDSALSVISHYKKSAILDILHNSIIQPFAKKWSKFYSRIIKKGAKSELKLNAEERRVYTESLSNIIKHLRRKDKYANTYLSNRFILDDVLKFDDNPFLRFHGLEGDEFNDVSSSKTNQIMSGDTFLLKCPLQILQLPDNTIRELFAKVDDIVKNFHCYLRDNVKPDNWQKYDKKGNEDGKTGIKTSFGKKKLDRMCKDFYNCINSENNYRLGSSKLPPLLRKDYYAWMYYAVHYVKNVILLNSYTLLILIRKGHIPESVKDVTDSVYKAINISIKNNNLSKENIIANLNKIIEYAKEEKKALKDIRDAINETDRNDLFFKNLLNKDQMIKYCREEYMVRTITCCLFFWWICGYIDYLRYSILRRKEGKNKVNKFHLKIKRMGLTRLFSFQKRTCDLAILFNQFDQREPNNTNRNQKNGEDGLKELYYSIGIGQGNNPLSHYDCNYKKSEKCYEKLQDIVIDILGK